MSQNDELQQNVSLLDVLSKIEDIVSDDACADFDMMLHKDKFTTEHEKLMAKKLSAIYRFAHAYNTRHSCHHVHNDWRTLPVAK